MINVDTSAVILIAITSVTVHNDASSVKIEQNAIAWHAVVVLSLKDHQMACVDISV